MKKCVVIYNPLSSRFNPKLQAKIYNRIKENNYLVEFVKSKFPGHVTQLIKEINGNYRIAITLGGDGTMREASDGFNKFDQRTLYSHLPLGTTNDMAFNLGFKTNDPLKMLDAILHGEKKDVDLLTVNGMIFCDASAFGYLTDVPYNTSTILKNKLGYLAYLLNVVKKINPMPEPINITYTKDGQTYKTDCVFAAVSNGPKLGGMVLHPEAKINDGEFEVLIIQKANCELLLALASGFLKKKLDLSNYKKDIELFKTNHTVIDLGNKLRQTPINNDGEKAPIIFHKKDTLLDYKVAGRIKMLLPQRY